MTGIQWTDKTWNPVVGCTPVSPGCLNCYAATMAVRLEGMGTKGYEPRIERAVDGRGEIEDRKTVRIVEKRAGRAVFTGDVRLVPERLTEPLKWRKPAMCFLGSMADVFHESVPFDYIDQIMAVIALCPDTIFQLPTKRPERMAEYFVTRGVETRRNVHAILQRGVMGDVEWTIPKLPDTADECPWPLPNLWLGTSIENDDYHARAWALLECPAAVRFLSVEPLIGSVDLDKWELLCKSWSDRRPTIGKYIDWVIVGGESGHKARPCNVEWIRSVVKQCKASGVPVFVKQLGSAPALDDHAYCRKCKSWSHADEWELCNKSHVNQEAAEGVLCHAKCGKVQHKCFTGQSQRLNDGKGGDMAEWPEDLRVREWPKVVGEAQSTEHK